MRIQIIPDDRGVSGKVADAEIHFEYADGILDGLRLIGFGIWTRRTAGDFNVTFPARQYSVNGERRSFALLRPRADLNFDSNQAIRSAIIEAYRRHVDAPTAGAVITTSAPAPQPTPAPRPTQAPALTTGRHQGVQASINF